MIKKTIENKIIQIEAIKQATEPIKQDLVIKKPQSYKTAITIDKILELPFPRNGEILKKEENKINKIMKTQSISKRTFNIKGDDYKATIDN